MIEIHTQLTNTQHNPYSTLSVEDTGEDIAIYLPAAGQIVRLAFDEAHAMYRMLTAALGILTPPVPFAEAPARQSPETVVAGRIDALMRDFTFDEALQIVRYADQLELINRKSSWERPVISSNFEFPKGK